ncbi:SUMF1/EgtB/PvdO family nonheme iron enzyme [Parabacteroides sp. OttesenSCG-928-G06]|nr:SUMF1/EgtB/PvdO family nonheme iron enzyme [Parabacteroides sp. OttesenSCG-928-K15]MDL2281747.1 SUMF1/EgtB/PvdO family nonheme iron enzyme [Parabacteroides sp. OttesenSCG-928-G06]
MGKNRSSQRYPSDRKSKFFKGKTFIFLVGLLLGIGIVVSAYLTSAHFSTDESCMICHVHPHVEDSWKLSTHVNNGSGVKVSCVDCHLPPQTDTWDHYTAKLKLGLKDVWGYMTKDSADFNWDMKSELEHAVKYIPNQSCKKCHQNLFPEGITQDGITAHLYYDENEKKLDLQCISCHLDVGHYNPNYTHSKLTGIPGSTSGVTDDPSLYFREPAKVTEFRNYTEQIPGTLITVDMVAIPGGTFQMGSSVKESFRKEDEGPVRTVTVSPFFMAEVETTWEQYWAFYAQTMSEGRIPPEIVFANNSSPDVDAISGPTPPFGNPDQGWGGDGRPAITMTHYAAETFCQWLSQKTGKNYRLPTEAEWEYAARGGTETPYFFPGNPKEYSNLGFWRKFFDAKTDSISTYIIYANNSRNRTQKPELVRANPFGLKNMLGNAMEYCADKYDPQAYIKWAEQVNDPLVTEGEEWVVRGGDYTSDASEVRVAARGYTQHDAWLKTDPQQPKSIWWYSDVRSIGFRVVCEASSAITND